MAREFMARHGIPKHGMAWHGASLKEAGCSFTRKSHKKRQHKHVSALRPVPSIVFGDTNLESLLLIFQGGSDVSSPVTNFV